MWARIHGFWRRRSGIGKLALIAAAVLAVGYVGAVVMDNARMSRAESSLCVPASSLLLSRIEEGLTVTGGGSLQSGFAVRSGDYEQVYFVAAEIQGTGMDGPGHIGLWATNRLETGGLTYSVNTVAREFSDWGDGNSTDAELSTSSDGAREALRCAVLRAECLHASEHAKCERDEPTSSIAAHDRCRQRCSP